MTDELKQEIESARELVRTGDYNEHPCEIGYAETIVDLADRIKALEAEIARKDALIEKAVQAGLDAGANLMDWRDAKFIRALSASEIVKEMCGE